MENIAIKGIQFYQRYISPYHLPTCRFVPNCSQYAIEAIEEYGLFKGIMLSGWRLLRCQPLCAGGYDPVK